VVGTATLDYKDSARNRALTSEIFFAAQDGTAIKSYSPILPIAAVNITRGATPDAGFVQRPLIVTSHGNWGTRFSQGWLARELVYAGYVVLSTSHPGTMNDNRTPAGIYRLWDRSQDVRVVLDQLLADPVWSRLVDAQRIGFWGHSFGGWTGLSLAGARLDMQLQTAGCQQQQPKDMYCDGLVNSDFSQIPLAGSGDSDEDPRIQAFCVAATSPGAGLTPESLRNIHVPVAFDTAQFDTVLAAADNAHALALRIPGATEVVRPVGHFSYVPMCRPLIGKLAAALICTDPEGVDRAALHKSTTSATLAFFAKHLAAAQ
jgi:predicted dienelactone hydrolase